MLGYMAYGVRPVIRHFLAVERRRVLTLQRAPMLLALAPRPMSTSPPRAPCRSPIPARRWLRSPAAQQRFVIRLPVAAARLTMSQLQQQLFRIQVGRPLVEARHRHRNFRRRRGSLGSARVRLLAPPTPRQVCSLGCPGTTRCLTPQPRRW